MHGGQPVGKYDPCFTNHIGMLLGNELFSIDGYVKTIVY